MSKRPVLAVTMGDPAGIGPEIAIKAFSLPAIRERCVPVLIGDAGVMRHAASEILKSDVEINAITDPAEAADREGVIDVVDLACVDMDAFAVGKVSAMCGDAAFRSVARAIELALAGKVDGTVTNPLNKAAMNLAGHRYDGHTEIYAALTGTRDYAMLLAGEGLRVVHATTHVRMADVPKRLSRDRIRNVISLGDAAVRKFGVAKPRIAVSGYNPHAGENGLFGDEEQLVIEPAIADAVAMGIDASGPYPPDTVFCKAVGGAYDLVVAMYHDQGHIPMKLLSFKYDAKTDSWSDMTGVNITLGLPIIRTSVDHGTAFEQAGRGQANPNSLIYAIECGAMLATDR